MLITNIFSNANKIALTTEIKDICEEALSLGLSEIAALAKYVAQEYKLFLNLDVEKVSIKFVGMREYINIAEDLFNRLSFIHPNLSELQKKHDSDKYFCKNCSFLVREANIWCSIYPDGFPGECKDKDEDLIGLQKLKRILKVRNMTEINRLQKELTVYEQRLRAYKQYYDGNKKQYDSIAEFSEFFELKESLETALQDTLESIDECEQRISSIQEKITELKS